MKPSSVTRESVLHLLSDDEAAQVSSAETNDRLPDGDEYIDLGSLHSGVQRASSRAAVHGRVVPRKAISAWTWSGILSRLAALGVSTGR